MALFFPGLSGRGRQVVDPPIGGDTAWRAVVTDLGTSEAIDLADPKRYAHVGWIAFFEDSPYASDLGNGDSLFPAQWIQFARASYATVGVTEVQGVNGFWYAFGPGVVCTIEIGA